MQAAGLPSGSTADSICSCLYSGWFGGVSTHIRPAIYYVKLYGKVNSRILPRKAGRKIKQKQSNQNKLHCKNSGNAPHEVPVFGFVTEVAHAKPQAKAAADQRPKEKRFFGNTAVVRAFGSTLIPPAQDICGNRRNQ